MKVLMMNCSPAVVEGIERYLPAYDFDAATDLEQFELQSKSNLYDCIILDISLMENFALRLIRDIKNANKNAGLIITSGRDSLQERIEALTIGADDFLTIPFDVSELAVRIMALVRRKTQFNQEVLIYKEIRIDIAAKTVYINGLKLELTKKELELLLYLIEHKNIVIKKESLITYLSGQITDFKSNTDVIYAHVKNLKKKLTEAGCGTYLKTIYGTGYKWEDL